MDFEKKYKELLKKQDEGLALMGIKTLKSGIKHIDTLIHELNLAIRLLETSELANEDEIEIILQECQEKHAHILSWSREECTKEALHDIIDSIMPEMFGNGELHG